MAVGMAIAERHLNAEYGDELVDHRTWVVAGDGCLMEGINHEAAGLAGHLGLGRLIVFWDDNRITIDGATDLSTSEDIEARYAAYGWHVVRCDGLDADDVRRAIDEALADPRPSLIACRTIIGYGAPNKQGTAATHGAALGADEVAAAREELGWDHSAVRDPGRDPADGLARGGQAQPRRACRLAGAARRPSGKAPSSAAAWPGDLPDGLLARRLYRRPDRRRRRRSRPARRRRWRWRRSTPQLPETIGGSADLTGSNNTKTKDQKPLTKEDYSGRYLYYGIREFGMAAAMNGMALHGGVIPYGGTFLIFSDYARPAIRLSALQQVRVDLCDDPRFDRARRGRADPPAGRASDEPAGDAQSRRLPPRRRGRDRRMLGAGAAPDATARRCSR